MTPSDYRRFEQFDAAMRQGLPRRLPGEALPDSLLLERDGELNVFYAPMDYVESRARIVLVGITPTRTLPCRRSLRCTDSYRSADPSR